MQEFGLPFVLGLSLLVSACGSDGDRTDAAPSRDPGQISRADLGDKWPLTVESGTLACRVLDIKGYTGPRLTAVTFRSGGITYAVNGVARSHRLGPEVDSIWAPGDPVWIDDLKTKKKVNVGPPKKDISPLRDCHKINRTV